MGFAVVSRIFALPLLRQTFGKLRRRKAESTIGLPIFVRTEPEDVDKLALSNVTGQGVVSNCW